MRNMPSAGNSCHNAGGLKRQVSRASWSWVTAVAFGLIASSCASVHEVSVVPSTACPGDPVTVSWTASGSTEMAVIPVNGSAADAVAQDVDLCVDALASGAKLNPEPSRGSAVLQASGDAVYFVQARGRFGKPAHECARLFVNQVLPLSDVPECVPRASGTDGRAAQVHLVRPNGSRWSGTTTTGLVENDNLVAVTVRHAGKSIVLSAGTKTSLFAGTDPNADWWVEYAWASGPPCGNAGAAVPNSLSIEVHPLCPSSGRAIH